MSRSSGVPIPEALIATAREFARGEREPAAPRDAATVVLMREGRQAGIEVYLLQRRTSMAFAGGMSVFPGGGVDRRDFDTEVGWSGPSPAEWAGRLGTDPDTARALVCAAVRETFEESGVLLAGESESSVVADTTGEDWEADRVALEGRELSFTDFLNQRGLVVRSDLLGAFSAWLTPIFEPRRFRTWFFAAVLPEGQVTRDVSTESSRVSWQPALEAVQAADDGRIGLMPPTYLSCLEVAEHATPPELLAACADRVVEMFTPTLIDEPDGAVLSRPPGADELLARHSARLARAAGVAGRIESSETFGGPEA